MVQLDKVPQYIFSKSEVSIYAVGVCSFSFLSCLVGFLSLCILLFSFLLPFGFLFFIFFLLFSVFHFFFFSLLES